MVLELVAARRGHFQLESGYHSALWLDLDPLFSSPRRIEPLVTSLAEALRPHDLAAVCGPLLGGAFLAQLLASALDVEFYFTERVTPGTYRLPPALTTRVRGKRIAIVDDVMSAGSALRGTYAELLSHGALVVAAGALLVLGNTGAAYFVELGVPVEANAREEYELWLPADCPMCRAGLAFEELLG